MRVPYSPSAAPSYSELFAEGCFGQRALVSGSALREAANWRGLGVRPFPRTSLLEPLDRSAGFSPVGFLQTNYTPETTWMLPDPELVSWREEQHFMPWDGHGWRFRETQDHVTVSERYSSWQLLYLDEALNLFAPHIAITDLQLGVVDRDELISRRLAAAAVRLAVLDEEWRSVVKLLVALQPRLWPYRTGRTTQLHDPGVRARIDPLAWVSHRFDPMSLLRRFEMSLDDLALLHLAFAEAARKLDPAPRWHRLTEAAPRKVTDDLRGDALRARDRYDAAYLLRGLYFLATERWLPPADELSEYRTVYERRRLHRHRAGEPGPADHAALKPLLIREGLYPHLIHFFVEGHTERIVLERLLPFLGYSLTDSGMAITNIRGVDQAQRHEVLFRSATQVAARTVLIADLEGTLSKALARLRADGLFTDDENVLLWSRDGRSVDFEEANFSAREIVAAMRAVVRQRDPTLRLPLTVAELRHQRVARTRPRRPPPALTKLALQLAEEQGFRLSKQELAIVFAEKLVREIKRSGHVAEAGKTRPLLRHLWVWIVGQR